MFAIKYYFGLGKKIPLNGGIKLSYGRTEICWNSGTNLSERCANFFQDWTVVYMVSPHSIFKKIFYFSCSDCDWQTKLYNWSYRLIIEKTEMFSDKKYS